MASKPIYQFYAELNDYEPKIWRRFQIANNALFSKFAYVIMTMFEMQASHLFRFEISNEKDFQAVLSELDDEIKAELLAKYKKNPNYINTTILLPWDEEYLFPDNEDVMDATEEQLKDIFKEEGEEITFEYDFGDGWEISLKLEKMIIDKELPGRELPRVIDGEGYGIIENCGGVYSLKELRDFFKKKSGSRYREFCEILGTDELDLDVFDLDDMNFRLKKIPRIYADIYESDLEPTEYSLKILNREYKK